VCACAHPDALAARGLTLDELATALNRANANTPVGTLDGARQTLTIQANRQMTSADAFRNIIVASQPSGAVVRLSDVAEVEDSVETIKTGSWLNNERSIVLAVQRQPDANTVAVVDASRARCRACCADAGLGQRERGERPLDVDPRIDPRRAVHAGADRGAGGDGDLPVPAPRGGHADSHRIAADLADRHRGADEGVWLQPGQRRCWPSRWPWAWWWTTPS
jgi:hypothetical protein